MPLDLNTRLQLAKTDPDAIAYIFGSNIAAEDSYLYQRLGGNYAKYEEILLDPQVRGKLAERVGALLGRSVLIDPASPATADREAAKTVQRIVNSNLLPYERICKNFLYSGLIIGFSVQAVVKADEKTLFFPVTDEAGEFIKLEKQSVLLPSLEFVPQRRFTFRYHEPERTDIPVCADEEVDPSTDLALVHGYELRLLTRRAPFDGERCPKDRFFTYTFGSLKGLPFGYGIGAVIRKFYEIRREVLRSGVLTGDRLGSPPTHGTYPDDLDDRDPEMAAVIGAFRRLVAAISPNANAVTTDGFKINFLESRSGGHTVLKWLYDTAGVEISRAVWGEGSYAEKSTGSYAAEQQQAANRNENIVDADCNDLDEKMGAQLWRWIAEKNYPKANPPRIRRETVAERRSEQEVKQREELRGQRAVTDRTLILDLGLTVTQEYISNTYGPEFRLPERPSSEFSEVEFGAYPIRFLRWQGLKIGVKHEPGTVRFPQFRSAKKLASAYGYVEGHRQNGRSQRCYVYPGLLQDEPGGNELYAVTQLSPATGEAEELKWMIAYPSMEEAEAAYRREIPEVFFGGIRKIDLPQEVARFAEVDSGARISELGDKILDAYEDRLTRDLTTAYGESIVPIQQFIKQIANSDGSEAEKYRKFVDGIFDLYERMDPQTIAQVLGKGLAAGHLAGMYSERIDRE